MNPHRTFLFSGGIGCLQLQPYSIIIYRRLIHLGQGLTVFDPSLYLPLCLLSLSKSHSLIRVPLRCHLFWKAFFSLLSQNSFYRDFMSTEHEMLVRCASYPIGAGLPDKLLCWCSAPPDVCHRSGSPTELQAQCPPQSRFSGGGWFQTK